ncbi:MAG TPA: PepSY domain-containing protein [Candidatus Stackebrandtia excrementipullorum]|nr:PepSY domain-containing protein [Candidatus Stackebrandtia excrementipullorum]
MKKSLLNRRRGWFIAGTAAAVLLGSAAVATASLSGDDTPAPSGYTQNNDHSTRTDDDVDDYNSGDPTPHTATEISPSAAAEVASATVPDGVVTSIELEGRKSDKPVWNVDLVSPGYEHEIDVDATTGEILEHERDDEDDDWREDSDRAKAAISIADAEAATLGEVPDGLILEMELDGSTHTPIWEVEVFSPSNGTWKDLKINGTNGSIISVNNDDDDDDDRYDDDDDDDDDD